MVQLCVADSGHGIAASDMQSIFEPFWTSKVNGMGMGLAICHSVAVAHHGSLTVATAAQGGAVFCLQLPPATT
ncbi:MAG: ATP-binding protein, partial [Candidatus Dechloromonas phosphoritropha]